jgi:hypothetical protein
MSIEKESSGLPEMSVRRRTTKVNLSIITAVVLFFAVAAAVAVWFGKHSDTSAPPRSPTENR